MRERSEICCVTIAGTYTFTVTGTGNDRASTTESATFTLTVN